MRGHLGNAPKIFSLPRVYIATSLATNTHGAKINQLLGVVAREAICCLAMKAQRSILKKKKLVAIEDLVIWLRAYGKRTVSKSEGRVYVSDLRLKLKRTSEIGTYVRN